MSRPSNTDQKSVRAALIDSAKQIHQSSLTPEKKAELLNGILAHFNSNMATSGQQDSEEFLIFFLDYLLPAKDYIVETKEATLLNNDVSTKTELHTKLEIELSSTEGTTKQNFSALLKTFQRPEVLEEKERVSGYTKTTRSLKTQNTNCDIVFSLKRFEVKESKQNFKLTKLSSKVEFDQIDLTSCGGETTKYEPTAFIVHIGGTNSGHYVAYVKEKTEHGCQWFYYDDSQRTPLTESLPEQAKGAYIVKYSPVANESAKGNDRYKNGLPTSLQDAGIKNQGAKCWAIAGLTFALSMSSLSLKNLETPEIPEFNFNKDAAKKHFPALNDEKVTQITTITPQNHEIKNPQFTITTTRDLLEQTNNPSQDFRKDILTCIRHNQADLTDQEVGAIILIAIKNRGIGNNIADLKKDLKDLTTDKSINTTKSVEELTKAAIKFSRLFQEKAKENHIFTGNKNATSLEGMRLKRLDPSFAKQFLGEEKYQEIYDKFKISEIEKKEQETASPHPEKPKGKPLGKDQEQQQK